ncbi:MAG: hypothetical protein ACR2NV_01680 [Thermoleophilaceae bacterium]
MPPRQRYRLRTRSDREVIREVEPGAVYVDRESGEEFQIVGKVLPLAPSPSSLPWSVENLRICGCSLEQLAPKDLNDCPHCGRRLPAVALEGLTGDERTQGTVADERAGSQRKADEHSRDENEERAN